MKSVPQVNNSYGMEKRATPSNTSTASRSSERYVNSYSGLDAGLTIQTREGDVVTLSASQHSEFESYEYSSRGVVSNEEGYAAASYNVREITLRSGETFTFSVEGDLSEDELEDIESIITGVDGIIGEMMDGDLEDAVSQAMSLGHYDTISAYEADITVQHGYAMYSQEQTATTGAMGQDPARAYLGDSRDRGADIDTGGTTPTVGNLEATLLDRVTELLEKHQEESLARARDPLSSLFDHYLEIQDANEVSEAQENEENTLLDGDDTVTSFSDVLKAAAQAVDRTITDMVKGAFDNRLESII